MAFFENLRIRGSSAANIMEVKASSTTPVTTDPAGVVSLSPNSAAFNPFSLRSSRIHAQVTLTTTTETTVIPGSAGLFNDVVNIVVSNLGAGNDTVIIRSGVAGTELMRITTLANTTQVVPLTIPIPGVTVNTPITAQLTAASATGVQVAITAIRTT